MEPDPLLTLWRPLIGVALFQLAALLLMLTLSAADPKPYSRPPEIANTASLGGVLPYPDPISFNLRASLQD
jgi:hypothetical protein